MTTLLALDPGGTTGYSLWSYDATTPLTLIEFGQIPGGVEGFCRWWRGSDVPERAEELVAETFVDDGRTASPDITPLRIEGALVALWGENWIGQRNFFKAHADDLLLKRHDLWFVGQEHARDSARHAIGLQKARRHLPTMRKFWPPRARLHTVA